MKRRRLFHGWVIVAAVFAILTIGFGIVYSFGAFFESFQTEFGASRGSVSFAFSLCGFLYFSLGAASGPVADRLGARWMVFAGMLLAGGGLLLASRAQTLWQVYATYGGCLGVGVGLAYVPAVGAVQRWFVVWRGLASGFAVAGIGVGTLVFPVLSSKLINTVGWRGACVVLGLLALAAGASISWLIEDSPARRGLLPDGADPGDLAFPPPGTGGPGSSRPVDGSTLGQALRSSTFWLFYVGGLLACLGLFIPFVHLTAYARDHGLSESTGVLLLGLIGVGSLVGRFVLGGAADKLGRRASLCAMYAGMAVMMLWWLGSSSAWALGVFAVLFGAFYGGYVALSPALMADYFGGRSLGAIIGVLYTSPAFGALVGPPLAGVAFDMSHSYTIPIGASAVTNVLAFICVFLVPNPPSAPAPAPPASKEN